MTMGKGILLWIESREIFNWNAAEPASRRDIQVDPQSAFSMVGRTDLDLYQRHLSDQLRRE